MSCHGLKILMFSMLQRLAATYLFDGRSLKLMIAQGACKCGHWTLQKKAHFLIASQNSPYPGLLVFTNALRNIQCPPIFLRAIIGWKLFSITIAVMRINGDNALIWCHSKCENRDERNNSLHSAVRLVVGCWYLVGRNIHVSHQAAGDSQIER